MTITETIKKFNGVKDPKSDLGLEDAEYEDLINEFIIAAEEWINKFTRTSYTTYPAGLEQIIIEIVSNITRSMIGRQDTSVSDTEETTSPLLIETVITEDIKARLKPYRRNRIKISGIGTKTQRDRLRSLDYLDDVI